MPRGRGTKGATSQYGTEAFSKAKPCRWIGFRTGRKFRMEELRLRVWGIISIYCPLSILFFFSLCPLGWIEFSSSPWGIFSAFQVRIVGACLLLWSGFLHPSPYSIFCWWSQVPVSPAFSLCPLQSIPHSGHQAFLFRVTDLSILRDFQRLSLGSG